MSLNLTDRLRVIGVRVASENASEKGDADIERTLLDAVEAFPGDARLASLILSWIQVHGAFVVVEKLKTLAARREKERPGSTRWLAAIAAFSVARGGHRWKVLARRSKEPVCFFPEDVTRSAVRLKGAVDWLGKINFVVPNDALRIRESDVLEPTELIRRNRQYRNRYLYGPSWRADIVTAIEGGLRSPAEIARAVGCSYEPAHRVCRQIAMARGFA